MIDPTVRPATHSDIDQLRFLEHDARKTLVEQRGGGRWLTEHPEIGTRWATLLDDSSADVVVAHIDEVIVGFLVAILGSDAIIRVDQVWVDPMAREVGFGDELLATVIARARAEGAVAVEGQSLPGDRQTKNLYERAGIVARLITTYKQLTD